MGDARATQVGGDHYSKRAVQPWDVWAAYPEMDPWTAAAVQYLMRWRDKGGLDDVRKAIHNLERLIEVEEARRDADPFGPVVP